MIKRIFKKYRALGFRGVRAAIRYRVARLRNPTFDPTALALKAVFSNDDFTIVQIGAFVGDSGNDPLFKRVRNQLKKGRGRLICVEPVKEHYDALVENYRGVPNVFCENVAIAEKNGEAAFYRLGVDPVEHGHPAWLSQLSSLKKDRMESLWEKYESNPKLQEFYLQHRVEETVQCLTLAELLRRHNVQGVDLLQIDTEGYELEILSTIDFSAIPIRFVNYECVLLHENKGEAEKLMGASGYLLVDHGQDTFCYRENDKNIIGHKRE